MRAARRWPIATALRLQICLLFAVPLQACSQGADTHRSEPAPQGEWRSVLLPLDDDRRTVLRDGQAIQLPDVSQVGYRYGAAALGAAVRCDAAAVEQVEAVPGTDLAAPLQAAIDAAAQRGGGVVRLPAGEFKLSQSIFVDAPGIAIVGAGSARTRLTVPSSYRPVHGWAEGVISLGASAGQSRSRGHWWTQAPKIADVVEPIALGQRVLSVDSESVVAVGQWIAIVQYLWPAASRAWSGGQWPSVSGWPTDNNRPDRQYAFVYLRRVTDVVQQRITVDLPIPYPLDPRDNPIGVVAVDAPARGLLDDVGVAGLTIEFAPNSASPRPLGQGVFMQGVRNGWIDDVHVLAAPRMGIHITESARVTVARSAVIDQQDAGDGGWGYGFLANQSQDVLIRDSVAADLRHGFLVSRMSSSRIVFARNTSALIRIQGDDTHYGPAQQIVWDQHEGLRGGSIHMVNRGDVSNSGSGGAHVTVAGAVIWNAGGDDALGGWHGGLNRVMGMLDQPILVIGGTKPTYQAYATFDDGRNLATGDLDARWRDGVWAEGVGQAGLQPASLHDAQTAGQRQQWRSDCGAALQPADRAAVIAPLRAPLRAAPDGDGTLWYDSDTLATVPVTGSGCELCEVDASGRSGQGLRLQLKPKAWGIGARLRGPKRAYDADHVMELSVRAASPDAQIRLRLALDAIGQDSDYSRHVDISVATDTWTTRRIPLHQFGGLSRYNVIEFRSAGEASATTIWLDDIRVVPAATPERVRSEPLH